MDIGQFTIPFTAQHYTDPATNRTLFRLLDHRGTTVAEGIEDDALARQFACAPCVVDGFESMLPSMTAFMACKWDFGYMGPDLHQLAKDEDGPLEQRWPGAPGEADWILELQELLKYARGQPGGF
jgi:hypothetical protein